jgi:hypothetical protein
VRAIAIELLDDALKKSEVQRIERAEKAAAEQATKRKAAIEAEAKKETKKRKSHKSIVSRLGMIEEPLRAIHDIAQLGLGADDHEAALVVASNLSMLCLRLPGGFGRLQKRLQRRMACWRGVVAPLRRGFSFRRPRRSTQARFKLSG